MNAQQPWFWRSHPLGPHTASHVFAALFLDDPIAVLLESPSTSETPHLTGYSICAGRPRQQGGISQHWTPGLGEILPFLRRQLATNLETPTLPPDIAQLPFTGGWLGWLGYDLGWEIEQLPNQNHDPLPFPIAFWYEPECFAVIDHHHKTLWFAASAPQQLDRLEQTWRQWQPIDAVPSPLSAPPEIEFLCQQGDYEAMVRQAKAYIRAGDIFQTNLSLRFSTHINRHPWQIYRRLHEINPSPFASYWQTPWGQVVSCSPERLLQLREGIAQTRPIAGTRPRGDTPERDRQLEAELLDNRKENAEHIMLVDLERNDLGRVCDWGSVRVNELLVVERYSHVMHLVSNVIGQLSTRVDPIEAIAALFPGGTITGCPKVRCMEIIEELEPLRRSLFYGSCGYLDQRGYLDLNILIRTLLCHQGRIWGQVGAGIVADSDPEQEWKESLSKAQAQLKALL